MATRKRRRKKGGDQGGGWRRSPITAVISLLVIGLCVANLFMGEGDPLAKYKADYVCRECRDESRVSFKPGEAPFDCEECGKKELYPSVYCSDCKKVSASLPPLQDFSCKSCDYNGLHRLDGQKTHPCPECRRKALALTYECRQCQHYFPFEKKLMVSGQDTSMGEPLLLTCPNCDQDKGLPIETEPVPSCEHCDSEHLSPVTPLAVVKWELGRKLNSREEKILKNWKAKQK